MPSRYMDQYTLVFDLDGTLVDTAPDLIDSLNYTMSTVNLATVDLNDASHLIGGGARALILNGIQQNNHSEEDFDIERLIQTFLSYYRGHISNKSRVYDGAIEMIAQYHQLGISIAICTNKSEILAKQLLREMNIIDLIHTVIGGDTLPVSKPNPRPLYAAIARVGGDIRRSVLIGDSITDLKTAEHANTHFIGVSFGYSDPPMSALANTFSQKQHLLTHYENFPVVFTSIVESIEGAIISK